jgi:hypothetical protein
LDTRKFDSASCSIIVIAVIVPAAWAMRAPYDAYTGCQSGKRRMSSSAVRCVELFFRHPKAAEELAKG